MVSTITNSTTSIVLATGSAATIGILVLLALLAQKEIASGTQTDRASQFIKIVNIGIIPLLVAFVLVVLSKVIQVLR